MEREERLADPLVSAMRTLLRPRTAALRLGRLSRRPLNIATKWSVYWALALGVQLAFTGHVRAEDNVPGSDSAKVLYDPRTAVEMDQLASAEAVATFTASLKADWTLFVEDRAHSIRKTSSLPQRWLNNYSAHAQTFNGIVQPGEFYVFQIGVFAAKTVVGRLAIAFSPLHGSHDVLPAASLRCFNLGGTNFVGQAFSQPVKLDQGKLQALWIGVDVLVSVYRKNGKALLALASWAPAKTQVKLTVDWQALGLDPKKTTFTAPASAGYQTAAVFAAAESIPVESGRGWMLIADETSRAASGRP